MHIHIYIYMANWAQAGLARPSLAYTCVLANWARAGVANPLPAYEHEHKPLFVKLHGEEHQFHSIRSAAVSNQAV
jgi:hypothetical protein